MRLDNTYCDIPGITRSEGERLAEFAVSCMARQNHASGVSMECRGIVSAAEEITWTSQFTPQLDRSTLDLQESTEHGAEWISILFAIEHTRFTVLERSWKGTGFDYWLTEKESTLFQNAARFEISGILDGKEKVKQRIVDKLAQVSRSDWMNCPAYVSVVEFSQPSIDFIIK